MAAQARAQRGGAARRAKAARQQQQHKEEEGQQVPEVQEALEQLRAEMTRTLRTPVVEAWPRFRYAHLAVVTLMVAIMVVGSTLLSTIDEVTLKPSERFPPFAKAVAFYSNIPIKVGVVHVFLYGCELWFDPAEAKRHIGQRLTTLWVQFFENPRWGQHFHMQLETFLQVVDIFSREADGKANRFPDVAHAGFAVIAVLMMVTNLVTSSAYHTFEEQTIGAGVAIVKVLFDYYHETEGYNPRIGAVYTDPKALAGGAAITAVFVWCGKALLGASLPLYVALVAHPTTLATVCYLGACLTQEALARNAVQTSSNV